MTSAISGQTDAGLKVGLYGDIASVQDNTPHEWRIYCLDKHTGAVKWQQTAYKGVPKDQAAFRGDPRELDAGDRRRAADRVLRFGRSVRLRPEGHAALEQGPRRTHAAYYEVPEAQWETGSSPIIHDGIVVVQADVLTGSFLLATFDAATGKELWRDSRSDVPTWGTPTVHTVGGRTQLIVNGMRHAGAYDLETGKEVWKLSGGGDIPVPTPVASDGLVFITNAHGSAAPVYAIRETASGDISLTAGATSNQGVAWSYPLSTGGATCARRSSIAASSTS